MKKFKDIKWTGLYQLKPYNVYDGAVRWTKNMYVGSNALQVGADVLTGVGMQFVGDNDDRHLIFTTANGGILDVKTDKFLLVQPILNL